MHLCPSGALPRDRAAFRRPHDHAEGASPPGSRAAAGAELVALVFPAVLLQYVGVEGGNESFHGEGTRRRRGPWLPFTLTAAHSLVGGGPEGSRSMPRDAARMEALSIDL